MSYEKQSISMHYARAVIQAAQRHDVAAAPLLEAAVISEEMFATPGMRMMPYQLAALMQTAWRLEDDEFMGMAATPCRHGVFSLMAHQVVHRPNLRSVYRHLCRFYNLTTQAFELDFHADKDIATLSMRLTNPSLDVQHMLIDFMLLLWHRFPAWLTGQRIPLHQVTFDFPPPPHAQEYRLLFPCPALFEQPSCSFSFPSECLSWPVVQTTETLREHLQRAPLDWFQKQNYYPTYTRQLLDALTDENRFYNRQIEDIASQLAITPRTLRRKLVEENTSFREIKNIARRDMAIYLLAQKKFSVAIVAQELGYTEAASFCRAFKEWTGVTPFSYKK